MFTPGLPWRALFVAIATLLSSVAAPLPYTIQLWQTREGLPQNGINAIIQSREGYLWLATYGGLVRFDGVRFKTFDASNSPDMQNSRVTALFEDTEGTLWLGHETGDLTRYKNGCFETIPIPGDVREKVISIVSTPDRKIRLTLQSGRLRRMEDGSFVPPSSQPEQLAGMNAGIMDKSGAIWLLHSGAPAILRNDKLDPVRFDNPATDNQVFGLGPARDGGVWIVKDNRLRKWRDQHWANDLGGFPGQPTFITALVELKSGAVCLGTVDQGLFLLRAGADPIRFNRETGLPQDWIRSLCEDHEGNLWVGVGSGGLAAIRPARVMALRAPDAWEGRTVTGITASRDGALWIGTEGAGLYRYFNDDWTNFGAAEGIPNPFVWSLAEDKSGHLWAGTWGNGIAIKKDRFEPIPGLPQLDLQVPALYRASNDTIWIGSGSGLLKYENGAAYTVAGPAELTRPDVRTILEDSSGVIWFGMSGGGLGRLQNGKVKQFLKKDGLPSDFVQALYADKDGTLWIGTSDAGLARFREGKFSSVNSNKGLPNNVIGHIADDGLGFLWISSYGGLIRASKANLNRVADGDLPAINPIVFGLSDGMPSLQSSSGLQPSGCRTADGRLWFSATTGVVSVDPATVTTNLLAPRVLIEDFSVDQSPLALTSEKIRIPPGRQIFDFQFTALSFAAPERVRFRYRLEGLEHDWISAGARRAISYSYLPPGDYQFRVIACNNDGIWNNEGATLAFTVMPFIWQTLWFKTLVTLALVIIAAATALTVTRRRYLRRMEIVERQRALERERSRIAQDIHDDIGASLTRITMLSQSARPDDLDRIYDTARDLTRSLDEIVWAVNPRHDTLDSLATYLGKFAQDFLGSAGIRCRLDVPLQLPSWPLTAELRHNVFLAFKEALNNAVKHSHSTEIRIALVLERNGFTLCVEDNGIGFDEKNLPRRSGLDNMHRRLAEIGGSFQIEVQPSKGTRITFNIPVTVPSLS